MTGEGRAAVEDEVFIRIERDGEAAVRRQTLARMDGGKIRLGQVDIEVGGPVAEKAEHDRPVRRMALPGIGERTVEGDPHSKPRLRRRIPPPPFREQLEKGAGRRHRPHRVRRGRTDSDLEDVEDAEKHVLRLSRIGVSIVWSARYGRVRLKRGPTQETGSALVPMV